MKIVWTLRALRCLDRIGDFIALDDPRAAIRWIARLRARMRKVAAVPNSGRRVPEQPRDDVREVIVGAYRIIYKVGTRDLYVVAVLEGHQLLPEDLLAEE